LLDGALRGDSLQSGPLVLIVTGANIDIEQHRRVVAG
jgi:threonine dehydratase